MVKARLCLAQPSTSADFNMGVSKGGIRKSWKEEEEAKESLATLKVLAALVPSLHDHGPASTAPSQLQVLQGVLDYIADLREQLDASPSSVAAWETDPMEALSSWFSKSPSLSPAPPPVAPV